MLMFLLSMHTVVFWGQAPTPADSTECFYIVYLLLKINPSFPERTGNKTSLRVWIFISLVLASLFVTETWLGGQPSGARSGATHMLLSCSLLIRINGSHDTLTPQFHADTLGPCLTLSHCRRNAKKKKKKKLDWRSKCCEALWATFFQDWPTLCAFSDGPMFDVCSRLPDASTKVLLIFFFFLWLIGLDLAFQWIFCSDNKCPALIFILGLMCLLSPHGIKFHFVHDMER